MLTCCTIVAQLFVDALYPLYGELLEFETCCYSQGRNDCCQDFVDVCFYNLSISVITFVTQWNKEMT